ncbi:MAG TPA: hypothetical protein DCX06_02620 [Opitutae bacterium]|nr:hypothetical protein [Opitutae bacterium]
MKMKMSLRFILIIITLCVYNVEASQKGGRAPAIEILPPEGIVYEVKQYRESNVKRACQIGIAYSSNAKEALPIVIFIHGGGWSKGDKDIVAYQALRYAKRGYVGITLSYRLVQESPFPTCIYDVKEAIRYIKSICGDIPGDLNRIGLQGYSAGAHLALVAALSDEGDFHSGMYSEYDSKVQCVVAVSAPTDFIARKKIGNKCMTKEQREDDDFLKSVSPVYLIHEKQVPVFMMHGDADDVVKTFHYENFQRRCILVGNCNFILDVFPGGNHTYFFKNARTEHPKMDRFFDEHLLVKSD